MVDCGKYSAHSVSISRSLPASSRYLLAPALRVMAAIYAAGSATRRFAYRHGLLSASALPAAVISIGNLTHGGTGV